MPCPHCGHYQVFVFSPDSIFAKPTSDITDPPVIGGLAKGYLRYDRENGKNPRWARYVCEKCEKEIDEKHRLEIIRAGRWVAANPNPQMEGNRVHESFHISELFTTINTSWRLLAQQWIAVSKHPSQLTVFINEKLGETATHIGMREINEAPLRDRRYNYFMPSEKPEESYIVPEPVLFILQACDVQQDRIEYLVTGHGFNPSSGLINHWHLTHDAVHGSPEDETTWEKLDEILLREYRHASGIMLPVAAAFIDMGNWQHNVIAFTAPREARRIYACKGFDERRITKYGIKTPLAVTSHTKEDKVRFVIVGTDAGKQLLFEKLSAPENGPGYIHFNFNMTDDYFTQLTNARYETDWSSGMPVSRWVPKDKSQREEILDMWVYTLACLKYIDVRWELVRQNFKAAVEEMKHPRAKEPEKKITKPPTHSRFKL
jgi:phage terminase large subunit GpA-like protein